MSKGKQEGHLFINRIQFINTVYEQRTNHEIRNSGGMATKLVRVQVIYPMLYFGLYSVFTQNH